MYLHAGKRKHENIQVVLVKKITNKKLDVLVAL